MEFKYINMKAIECGEKLSISKVLKACPDIELFENESIRHIIDYKWEISCQKRFYGKFFCYCVYMIILFWECDSIYWDR